MPLESNPAPSEAALPAETVDASEFQRSLSDKFKLATDSDEEAGLRSRQIQSSVQVLAQHFLAASGTVSASGDTLDRIQGLVAQIDGEISRQLNLIMHHPDFTKLEGAWRGLHHLVSHTETNTELKIRVLNITQRELHRELSKKEGTSFDQGAIFKKVYEEEFGTPGGAPYGVLIGDYEFGYSTPDILVLREMSKIAATAHCPFITAAAPKLLQMNSWQALGDRRELGTITDTPDYAGWRGFRETPDARFVGLTMPRFLARAPYSTRDNPVDEFAFEEDAASLSHDKYVWANSAYAMGVNIARAFTNHGWCARIRGVEAGGVVENLPVHSFPTDDGSVDMKCPTEISVTERREKELAGMGLMPLSHWKNTDYAVFVGAQSVQKPQEFQNPDDTANAKLSARLPYLFACCRFAHYLKCMVRDKIGNYVSVDQLRQELQDWIMNYVTDSQASEKMKLERPLSGAKVYVQVDPEDPGAYHAQFDLQPHFQLEEVNVALRLVSRLEKK